MQRQHGSGRANKGPDRDKRGSATDRRVRRMWLASAGSGFGGDGRKVPCYYCARTLQIQHPEQEDYIQVDRIVPGDSYGRTNIRPACWFCNTARGDDTTWTYAP